MKVTINVGVKGDEHQGEYWTLGDTIVKITLEGSGETIFALLESIKGAKVGGKDLTVE